MRLGDGDGRNPHLWPGGEFKLEGEKNEIKYTRWLEDGKRRG